MSNEDVHIKKLLLRFLRKKTTEQENAKIQCWLEEKEENTNFFLHLQRIYQEDESVQYIEKEEVKEQWSKLQHELVENKSPKRYSLKTAIFSVAAVVVLLISVGTFWRYKDQIISKQLVYTTQAGERQQVTLADGSTVWLNAASTLKVNKQFGKKERKVSLVGEAWFDVAKNSEKAFIVKCDEVAVKVHGTQFNVDAFSWDSSIQIALEEGAVSLHAENSDPVFMRPGELASFNKEMHTISLTKSNVHDISAWRDGVLHINNMSLVHTLKKLENYYGVTLQYTPLGEDAEKINLTVVDQPIQETIELLEMITNKKIKIMP